MIRRPALAAFLLVSVVFSSWADNSWTDKGSYVKIEETGRARRPFAWEAVRAGADMARFSVQSMKDGGTPGFTLGLAGLALTAPVAVFSVPLDLVAGPFRKRYSVHYSIRARIVGETGSPLAGASVAAETVAYRKTIDDDSRHLVYRNLSSATTDADGWFELSGDAFFGPNRDFSVALALTGPSQALGKLTFTRRRGKVGYGGDIPLGGRYRLVLTVPMSDLDDAD